MIKIGNRRLNGVTRRRGTGVLQTGNVTPQRAPRKTGCAEVAVVNVGKSRSVN